MAISFVGGATGTWAGATSGTNLIYLNSLSGGISSSANIGDLVIAVYATGSAADRALTITNGSSNYTLVGSELYSSGSTTSTNFRVAYRVVTSNDVAAVFGPTGNGQDAGAAAIYVLRGIDYTTPLDVSAVLATGAGSSRPNPAAITPITSGSVIVVAGGGGTGTGVSYTAGELSNFMTATSADTKDASVGIGMLAWSSGSYDPPLFGGGTGLSGDSWAAVTIAIRQVIVNSTMIASPSAITLSGRGVKDFASAGSVSLTGFPASIGISVLPTRLTQSSSAVNHYLGGSNTTDFARKVAASKDGSTIAVSGNFNELFIFAKTSGSWSQQYTNNAIAGPHISISDDGNRVVVGGSDAGSTQFTIYKRTGSSWASEQTLSMTGGSVYMSDCTISGDGMTIAGGSKWYNGTYIGRVEVWKYNGASWVSVTTLQAPIPTADSYFGACVSLNSSGTLLAVGAPYHDVSTNTQAGGIFVYRLAGTWAHEATLTHSDPAFSYHVGENMEMSGDGLTVVSSNDTSTVVFVYDGSWSQRTSIPRPGDLSNAYGTPAISRDGSVIYASYPFETVGGVSDTGVVCKFTWSGSAWVEGVRQYGGIGGARFGQSIATASGGNTLVASIPYATTGGQANAGGVLVLARYIQPLKGEVAGLIVEGFPQSYFVGTAGRSLSLGQLAVALTAPSASLIKSSASPIMSAAPAELALSCKPIRDKDTRLGQLRIVAPDAAMKRILLTASQATFSALGKATTQVSGLPIVPIYIGDNGLTTKTRGAIAADFKTLVKNDSTTHAGIYTKSGSSWSLEQSVTGSDTVSVDGFGGYGVAMSGDGNAVIVGAPQFGAGNGGAYYFTRAGATWTQQQKITAGDGVSDDWFGHGLAVNPANTTLLILAPGAEYSGISNAGKVYTYVRTTGNWSVQDTFGTDTHSQSASSGIDLSAAISDDGDTAVVGDLNYSNNYPSNFDVGRVYVRTRSGSTWSTQQTIAPSLVSGARFGSVVKLSGDGNTLAVLAVDRLYVYTRSGGIWSPIDTLDIPNVASVAVNVDGSKFVVGTQAGTGEIVLYRKADSNRWLPAGLFDGPVGSSGFGTLVLSDAKCDRVMVQQKYEYRFLSTRLLNAAPNGYALSGSLLKFDRKPMLSPRALSLVGFDALLRSTAKMALDPTSFAISGRSFGGNLKVKALPGAVTLSGVDAQLRNAAVVTFSAGSRTVVFSGATATLDRQRKLNAAPRVLVFSGYAFTRKYTLALAPQPIALTAPGAAIRRARHLGLAAADKYCEFTYETTRLLRSYPANLAHGVIVLSTNAARLGVVRHMPASPAVVTGSPCASSLLTRRRLSCSATTLAVFGAPQRKLRDVTLNGTHAPWFRVVGKAAGLTPAWQVRYVDEGWAVVSTAQSVTCFTKTNDVVILNVR